MPDNVIKTDIQDYWRRSYVGDKEIPSSNAEWDVEVDYSTFLGGYIPIASGVGVGSILDITPSTAQTWLRYKVIDFVSGDSVTYTCKPDNGARAVCFIDSSNKILAVSEYVTPSASKSGSLKAPFGTKKAILQTSLDSNVSFVINRNSSRLYAGDKEVDIMYAGDKVAYAKHKDNLIGVPNESNDSTNIIVNSTNCSYKFIKHTSDKSLRLPLPKSLDANVEYNISFDVTEYNCQADSQIGFYIYNVAGTYSSPFWFDSVGHKSFNFTSLSTAPAQALSCSLQMRSWIGCNAGDYVIIKNIKLERNIVDTEYSLAPSVTDNRVKIGKHWYNTCTIGSQEWLSENLNEDLKDVVVKDVDWSSYEVVGSFKNCPDVGETWTPTNSGATGWRCVSFNVSSGENIRLIGSGKESIDVRNYAVLDSSNKVLLRGDFITYPTSETIVTIPDNGVKLYYNREVSLTNYQCIQSTHTSEGTWEGYYNNDASYGVKGYGKLYTWDCICSGNETPSASMAKLLKDGWRVPTKADFDSLLATSGVTRNKLCEKWTWGGTYVGTNELGFSAMSCGYKIDPNGAFMAIDTRCILHSSTLNPSDDRQSYDLSIRETTIPLQDVSYKGLCRSIRLVRDVPVTLSAPPTTGSAYVASVDGNVGWVSE